MLDFLKNSFRNLAVVYFWVLLVSCAIIGGTTFYELGNESGGLAFLGVLLGLLSGVGLGIVYGGFVATFVAIEQNTAKTEANTAEMLEILKKNANAVNTVDSFDVAATVAAPSSKPKVNRGGGSSSQVAYGGGGTDYRSWWDSDGTKHESWIDADGNKHET